MIRKKQSWKILLCYLPGLFTYCPWFLISFVNKQNILTDFWPEIPIWKDMFWLILSYLSGRRILWYLCLLTGAAICVTKVAFRKKKSPVLDLGFLFTVSIVWVVGIVFLYSVYGNSLFVERYFMVIAPHILLITALGIDFIMQKGLQILQRCITSASIRTFLRTAALILLLFGYAGYCIICYRDSYIAIHKPNEEFRDVADYLIKDEQIWNSDTVFVGSNDACILDGFIDYYLVSRGYSEPAAVLDCRREQTGEDSRFYPSYAQYSEDELLKYNYVYCLHIHMNYDEMRPFLEEHYEQTAAPDIPGLEIWRKIPSKTD